MSFLFILSFLPEPSNSLDLIWIIRPKNVSSFFIFCLSSFISVGSLYLNLIWSNQKLFYHFCSYNSISMDIYHIFPPTRSFYLAILNTQRVDSLFVIIVYEWKQKNILFCYYDLEFLFIDSNFFILFSFRFS